MEDMEGYVRKALTVYAKSSENMNIIECRAGAQRSTESPRLDPQNPIKPSLAVHTVVPALGRKKHEDQKFKVILSYIAGLGQPDLHKILSQTNKSIITNKQM